MPITSCSRWIGTRSRSGPSSRMAPASEARAAAVPTAAGRQPRNDATARTIVKASTTSTIEAKNAAITAGVADQVNIKPPFQATSEITDTDSANLARGANVSNALISQPYAPPECGHWRKGIHETGNPRTEFAARVRGDPSRA